MSESEPLSECRLVTFFVAGEEYGVDVMKVREIICLPPITPSPHSPPFVEGIINLRGSVIPVISLRKRFGLAEAEHDIDTRVAIVDLKGSCVGFIVDSISDVMKVPMSRISCAEGFQQEWIEGIINLDKQLIVVMNPELLGDL